MTLKIATGQIHPDGSETRGGVASFANLEAFCAALNKGSAPSTGKQKYGPYWSPFDAPRAKGAKPDWQLLVLDFDEGAPSWSELIWEHVAYQTPSSMPEKPRWRVVIAVDQPIPFVEVEGLRKLFPGADPAAVKPTQIFWHRHPEHLAKYRAGGPFEWGHYLHAALEAKRPEDYAPPASTPSTPTMTKAALTEALYKLDPDSSYDDWLRIGMALHHEHSGSEDGFAEWLHWSERGVKFAGVNDLRSHWRSFKPGGGITGLSLLAMQSAKIDDFPVLTAEQTAAPGLKFIPLRDFAQPDPPPYMVQGLIEQGSLIGLIGQRKGGKSYVALDLAFATAQGRTWAGAPVVTPGPVLWVAAEGARSLATRRAPQWLAHYGDADIRVFPRAINLRNVEHVKGVIAAGKTARLIVIDSLRRVTPGAKENQSDEFAIALANAELIALETGATVCVIAHAGKADATSARGTSAIEDSIEIAFAVEKIDGQYRMSMPFARDEDDDDVPRYFALRRIEPAGIAPGVVVDWTVTPVQSMPEIKGHLKKKAWKVVQDMSGALRIDVVRAVCQTYDVKNSHVNRALGDLIEEGYIKVVDDKLFASEEHTVVADFETLLGVSNGSSD